MPIQVLRRLLHTMSGTELSSNAPCPWRAKNFCAASCCMSCRKGFHAFAISAGWPIADGANCFRSVATFSRPKRNQPLHSLSPYFGYVLVAMAPCLCWNDSPPYNFSARKGGRYASLIARRRKTPRAITADLSIYLLEVCPDILNGLGCGSDNHFREGFRTKSSTTMRVSLFELVASVGQAKSGFPGLRLPLNLASGPGGSTSDVDSARL